MESIKTRILQFALAVGGTPSLFSHRVFATNDFFTNGRIITAQEIIALAALHGDLNINWIISGRGHMLQTEKEILVETLEEELSRKMDEITQLKLKIKSN